MDHRKFNESLSAASPPPKLSLSLQALWHDAKGEWQTAHELVQEEGDRAAKWVHAYLHRKEGDASNARYWYRQAGQSFPDVDLSEEWSALVHALLAETNE